MATADRQPKTEQVESRSAPEVLQDLVARAERAGASDIHLQTTADGASVSFRLDGVMVPVLELPGDIAPRVFGRVKFLARLKTYQESLPQDGRIDQADIDAASDIRVATYPTVTGEKIVLRLFATDEVLDVAGLGFPDAARAELDRFLDGTAGLLFLTGPAGSGKTTTIYACLRHLAEAGGRHVITIEDPAERVIPGVMQTEVNPAVGLDFAKAARHLLRQDPQVLVIGEVRDEETANIAVRAALTGHMVIATLHAGSCKGVFERLFVMCEDRFSAVAATELVINQRLLRRRCAACGGAGCPACLETGYRGRVPAVEYVRVDDAMRAGLREPGAVEIAPVVPLERAARALVAQGLTDEAELRRTFGR
ncbi:MAG: ATPase, T2SS/T4P/T4SS family [Planctomycetota bacterium]